jgi:hypothetical protein
VPARGRPETCVDATGMAILHRFAAFDWRYSLRELALIIVGILVALWLNEWNAQRHHRIAELALLQEIRASLAIDLSGLQAAADALRVSEQRTSALRDHLMGERPYDAELDVLFGSAYGFRLSHLNTAPYEALKGRGPGLGLVSDDAVRLAIVRVFETGAAELRRADEVIVNVSFDVLRPYYLERFRDIEFLERATPLSYADVAADPYFRNLLDYRLVVLRRAVLPRYQQTIEDITGLVETIERELARRE